MGKINLPRVFLGGIAAGAFAVAVEYIAFLLGAYGKLQEALPAGAHLFGSDQLAVAALELFVGGPLAVWLYAATRPRFGAGPKNAVRTALYIWLVMMPYGLTILSISGLLVKLPLDVMVVMNIAALPFVVAGMLIGAAVYKE
jgi:hypothetical protein